MGTKWNAKATKIDLNVCVCVVRLLVVIVRWWKQKDVGVDLNHVFLSINCILSHFLLRLIAGSCWFKYIHHYYFFCICFNWNLVDSFPLSVLCLRVCNCVINRILLFIKIIFLLRFVSFSLVFFLCPKNEFIRNVQCILNAATHLLVVWNAFDIATEQVQV